MTSGRNPDRRLDRPAIAARLTELLGRPVSPRTVAELPIPYKVILKKATSTERDVDAYAAQVLAKTTLRIGGRQRPVVAVPEEV
jgi:hypothetical protein